MVLVNKIQEPVQHLGALLVGQAIDVLDVAAHGKDALPARNGVSAHYRVNSLQLGSDILRRASRLVVQLEPGLLGDFLKTRLLKGSG